MKTNISVLLLIVISTFIWSCTRNLIVPPLNSAISCGGSGPLTIVYGWSGGGCQIVITLDGGCPVTETGVGGYLSIYSGISSANHTVVISANGTTNTCVLNGKSGSVTILGSGVCSTPSYICP